MCRDRGAGAAQILLRIGQAQCVRLRNGQSLRHVSRQRVVGRGLIGDEVEVLAAACKLRHDVRRVAEQPDGERTTVGGRGAHARERVIE